MKKKNKIRTSTILLMNPSVDVYTIGSDQLEFYFISTRNRITMNVSHLIIDFISLIDGKKNIGEIAGSLSLTEKIKEVKVFVDYLYKKKVLLILEEEANKLLSLSESDRNRYDRQLCYFDSAYDISSSGFQKKLQSITVFILGVGAIGSGIALQLAMAGVRKFILLDKDILSNDSIERHFTFNIKDIGRSKVEALSDKLHEIDSQIECEVYEQIFDFDTDVDKWLKTSDFVVNTLDEPYIGYTSLKIGRACYHTNTPLYVAGGFDAHLMSTGELIIPNKTPCVDCYASYFTENLKGWTPKYNVEALTDQDINDNLFEVGGLASMSLFSISYAVIVILNFLATGNVESTKGRGEFFFDKMNISYFNIEKNEECDVCGNK